jgi:hypothetical protein
MFMVGALTTFYLFVSFHKRHEIGIQSFTLHETNMTLQHRTKHARLLGTIRCEVQKSKHAKRGLIQRNWSFLCSFIIWECKDKFRVLVSLIFVPRFFSALPRCQGKIGTQKAFSYTLPVHDSRHQERKKELTIRMVRFHF